MNLFAFTASQRAVVDAKGHCDGRRIDGLCFQRIINGQRTDRVGNGCLGHTGQRNDVACLCLFDVLLGKTTERANFGDAELFDLLADTGQSLNGCTNLQRAGFNAACQNAAHKRVGAQSGRQHAEIFALTGHLTRTRHVVDDQVEQRCQILTRTIQFGIGPAGTTGSIQMREVQLVFVGAKACEQVKTFVQRTVGFRIRFVDLVQNNNRTQAQGQRLGGHEFGLGHRALGGVNQQHNAVHHGQDALDLATKVSVAGGVDDVDARAFPFDRSRLGQNGDAAFTFQIVRVHGAFSNGLVFPERAGLFQEFIHQRCLAVVHVGNDRNVAKIHGNKPFQCVGRRVAP